jgi:2,3-bisphosphoglycerate-independent phosphoglycerate mutase
MSERTKILLLIGDGMGDRPVARLGGLTPLEAAKLPVLDRLAVEGECGLLDPIAPGVRAGSDTSHLALLGYDPHTTYTGRGPFEAAGIGLEVKPGDVCFRCNFATLEGGLVKDRRAGRIAAGTSELAAALNGLRIGEVTCLFKESVEHRAALVLRGAGLGHAVSDVDPHEEGVAPHEASGEGGENEKTAAVVNEFVKRSREMLEHHPVNEQRRREGKLPANIVLPRGAGVAPHLEPFLEHYGLRAAAVVETGLIAGIARYLGMTLPEVPGATGGRDTEELALARAVIAMLGEHDFVLCNLKCPDLGGHDDDPEDKMRSVEKMDRLVGHVVEHLPGPSHLAISADHSTPCAVGDHSGDPVPIVFWGPGVRPDGCRSYSERGVIGGGVGRIRGTDIMPILTNLAGWQEKYGA